MSHRYFTQDITGETARITGPDAAHLARVLRVAPGTVLTLCDGAGTDYEAEVVCAGPEAVELRVLSGVASAVEPSLWAEVCIGVPKGDRMDFAVQKAVELGASAIRPFYGAFSVAKPSNEAHKTERWQRIASEAAKQSGRGLLPRVWPLATFAGALAATAGCPLRLLLHMPGGVPLAAALAHTAGPGRVALFTGPEGGFAPDEAEAALTAGCAQVNLGPRILRCETAPMAALAALMALTSNLE